MGAPRESVMAPEMTRKVQVRVVREGFYLGDHAAQLGEILTVSRSRGEYLHFLGLAEMFDTEPEQ